MDKDKRDLILEFVLKSPRGYNVSTLMIKENILKELNELQIEILCRNIVKEQPDVAYISELGANKIAISSTEITIPFLKEGGFNEIERIKREKEEKELNKDNLEIKLKELQIKSLEYNETIRGLKEELQISSLLKNYWWIIASAIALGRAIGEFLV